MIRGVRAGSWIALAVLILALPACARSPSRRLPVYPVTGKVLVDGKPAKGAFVYFWPKEIGPDLDAYCPYGQADDQGEFRLSTYDESDGAPAGEYKVTFEWPERYSPISGRWEGDKLNGRFNDANSSKQRATVEAKATVIAPFELSK